MGIARKLHNLTHPVVGRILMLHRVVDQRSDVSEQRKLEVTVDYLKQTIQEYKTKGLKFLSIDDINHLSPFTSRLSPFACITFDDGYLDTLTLAYPILKETNTPFAVYMTRDFYRGTRRPAWVPEAPMLSTDQLRQLASDPLCTVGCHTCTHPRLSTLTVEQQRRELADCKTDLEQLLGMEICHLAYPHGNYNADTLRIAAELGFATAVTTSGRPVRTDARLLELDRITLS